jgi:transcription-repair coupling factor (superfamily II helicase)
MSGKSKGLIDALTGHSEVARLLESVGRGDDCVYAKGLRGALKGILAVLAHVERKNSPTLVVAPDPVSARDIFQDASFILDHLERESSEEVFLFEDLNLLAQDFLTLGELEVIFYRYSVLEKLIIGDPVLVIASRSSLGVPRVAPARYREKMIALKRGDSIEDKNLLLRALFDIGYRLVSRVREVGQVAGRGGIIDIFPPGRKRPVRIDLFGDEVDSLREFDPETQRSLGEVTDLRISPCFEAELLREQDPEELFDVEGNLRDPSRFFDDPVKFREFSSEEKDEFLARGFSYFDKAGIWDYLPRNSLVVVDAPSQTLSRDTAMVLPKGKAGDGVQLTEHEGLVHSVDDISRGLSIFQHLEILSATCANPQTDGKIPDLKSRIVGKAPGSFERRIEQYLETHGQSDESKDSENPMVIVSRSSERIREMFGSDWPGVIILHGELSEGFDLTPGGPVVFTDAELFPARKRGLSRARGKARAFTREELRDVRLGDYIVHVHHGIGVFKGIVQQKGPDGSVLDYILLEYAQNDRLYVPVEQIDQLYRYTSGEGAAPVINRLGTSDWDRLKRRVKKTMVRMAKDLLKLYRSRMEVTGHKFQPDTVWQMEVEDRFEFQETPGQLRSLDELKKDMESVKPMDRLICAEVGYGKTELAVRAALKCVLDGMQAAVLVPTTILAQQHYMTFQRRLKDLPVGIGILSRFKSRKEQKETLRDLKAGKVDILIGTHRILSKDVEFQNIGLLIVDEEQKFGVRHKEKIKFLKNTIDVLTLTATPIPRTLYMSLVGLRDISVIDTPPPDRLPIRTYVKRWTPPLVKNAIQAEVARGGQVYYLYNKVENIHAVADRLKRLVPEVKIAVGHGQMAETQLEKVMIEFMSGEHDVLICTTIIENGLDIPRVNTLVVEDAQNFGLAQLHQIRGRVGRRGIQAYAYFLFPIGKPLSGIQARRLEALADFSHLGAGYEIARRDLELRGAGNILGPEQHGFVSQLGFDLYSKVLSETISEAKDGDIDFDHIGTSGHVDCVLRLPVDARIPESYLLDQTERFALYRRLAILKSPEELETIRDEMRDRFGKLPMEAVNLLEVLRLRQKAMGFGIESISLNTVTDFIEVQFHHTMARDVRWKRIGDMVMRARLRPQPRGFLVPTSGVPEKVMSQVRHILNELEKACKPIAKPIKGAV